MTQNRFYSSNAVVATLSSGINSSATSMSVSATTGYPASTPFTLILDWGLSTQEAVLVTGVSGTTLTITRGIDGTTAASHSTNAQILHAATEQDFAEPAIHINASGPTTNPVTGATVNVHGIQSGSVVVGTTDTQTLTNKTLTTPVVNGVTISGTPSANQVLTASSSSAAAWANPAASGAQLTPTGLKTSGYTAAANDLVLCDVTAGGFTVTLPTTPATGTRLGIKLVRNAQTVTTSLNAVTVAAGGSDQFNDDGVTSFSVANLNEAHVFVYASGKWNAESNDLPIAAVKGMTAQYVRVDQFPFFAKADGLSGSPTDNTTAINNAITYAQSVNLPVYFPPGVFRVSQILPLSGTILQGASSGSYGVNSGTLNPTYADDDHLPGITVLSRLSSSNKDLIYLADGQNYFRMYDIAIDGNKNNNVAGDGVHLADGAAGQESQAIIERCYIHDNPGANVYLGHNRRANKVVSCMLNYAGVDGVLDVGSDNTIEKCIIGSNGQGGITLGATTTIRWATQTRNDGSCTTTNLSTTVTDASIGTADVGKQVTGTGIPAGAYIVSVVAGTSFTMNLAATSSGSGRTLTIGRFNSAAALTHVNGNDIYSNLVGIAVASGTWGTMLFQNGIDRHTNEGITLYDGYATSIWGNGFHSNGVGSDNTYGHIGVGANVNGCEIFGNNFGPQDNLVTNVASYAVTCSGSVVGSVRGDLGALDTSGTPSTHSGLIYAKPGVWAQTLGATNGNWTAADQGLMGWSMDVNAATQNSAVTTAGTLNVVRVHVPTAYLVTNILLAVTSGGSALTTGNVAGLWNAAGTLIGATSDQTSSWNSSGLKTMALTGGPFTIPAGDYYIGFWVNGTGLPSMARGNNQTSAAFLNAGMGSAYRTATANTGLTTTAPSLGTLSASNFSWWMAIS